MKKRNAGSSSKDLILYVILMLVSILLFTAAMTVLGNTKLIAPIMIVIGVYLSVGSLIKLCKMNETLKNTVLCMIDLLFWLP